jgi:hypothetical protein
MASELDLIRELTEYARANGLRRLRAEPYEIEFADDALRPPVPVRAPVDPKELAKAERQAVERRQFGSSKG